MAPVGEPASAEKEGLVGPTAGAGEKGGGTGGDGISAEAEDEVEEGSSLESSANAISKAAAVSGQKDVLADLSKLQQEVDALRGRYEGV